MTGDLTKIRAYWQGHPDLQSPMADAPEDSLWFRAVARTRDMFKMMMQDGEDIRFNDDPEETAQWERAVQNNLAIYDLLLSPVSNKRALERYRATLFEYAILEGNTGIVRLLLERGYPPQVRDDRGNSPLLLAAGEGRFEAIRLLLQYQASVNQPSFTETPLMRAVARDRPDMVRFLIKQGADVDYQIDGGQTALFLVVAEGNTRLFDVLLGFKVNLNAVTRFGRTPLMEAAAHRRAEMVRRLLAHGADPGATDAQGISPLMVAAGEGSAEIVALLLSAGVDVKARDGDGETALMRAVRRPGNEAVIRLLMQAGADADEPAAHGGTALSLARIAGHAHYLGLLRSNGAGRPPEPAPR